jgi:hypothetical protein
MNRQKNYVGVEHDHHGMTMIGTIIRDAWVFGLLPETETCMGWSGDRLDALYEQVSRAWEPYGHSVSALPEDLRARHTRIYDAAVRRARAAGWDPELGDDD